MSTRERCKPTCCCRNCCNFARSLSLPFTRALVAASRYLRTLLPRRKSLRLVMLWSHPPGGREGTERIVSYFEDFAPRVVEVGGAPTEARAFFREEAVRLATRSAAAAGGARFAPSADVDAAEGEADLPLIAGVVAHLCATTVDGGILIFLPTAELVATLALELATAAPYSDASRFCIVQVHAAASSDELQEAYRPAILGVRKIVVATSLGEHQVPVDGVAYVIDSGRTQVELAGSDSCGGGLCAAVSFCTAQEKSRRKARAARGYFSCVSAARAASLARARQPEMARAALEGAILPVLALELGDARQFLSLAPDPPPEDAIFDAIARLHQLGALGQNDELTPLGRCLLGRCWATAHCLTLTPAE